MCSDCYKELSKPSPESAYEGFLTQALTLWSDVYKFHTENAAQEIRKWEIAIKIAEEALLPMLKNNLRRARENRPL